MVPLKVLTLVVAGPAQPSVLVLQPVEDTPAGKARIVPIWIGPTEAAQIGMALTNLDTRVDSVVIYRVRGQVFFSHLILNQGGRLITLDARPSDSIALALRQDAPLYIEEDVLDAASFPFLFRGERQSEAELAEFKTFLDHISPEDFGTLS